MTNNNTREIACNLCGHPAGKGNALYRLPSDPKNRVPRNLCKQCVSVLRGLTGEMGTAAQYELRGYLYQMQMVLDTNEMRNRKGAAII